MLELLSDGFGAASLLLLCTFVFAVIRNEKRSFRKVLLLAFLITLTGYQLALWQALQSYPVFNAVCYYFSMQVPLAFWIMSKAFFDDDFEWNLSYWMKEAVRLFGAEPELTFQEIAYRMGIQSVATFNRTFKKETGLTPSE